MKYLIVDDNAKFRKLVREEISGVGDEVYELDDGLDVLKYYKEVNPDWVILDIQMKTVNGFEALKILKDKYPSAHVLILSNYSDCCYQQKAKSFGADAFLSKENLPELTGLLSENKTNKVEFSSNTFRGTK